MSAPASTSTPALAVPFDAIAADVADRAPAVDRGEVDLRTGLAELGEAGLLDLGLGHGTLADQAEVIRTLAQHCTPTAFSVWAHRTATGYVARWGSEALRDELLPGLRRGERTAATAMATAFQAALGLRELTVSAREVDGGLVLDGVIPWASNLFADGAVVVLPARAEDGRHLVVAVTTDQDGVELLPYPALLALGATASTTVRLRSVAVAEHRVLTDRFLDFLADVRAPFLLLQAAICLGLADAALAAAEPKHVGTGTTFRADHTDLLSRRDALAAEHTARLARGGPADPDLVRLRLEASELAVAATRHEAAVSGGAGYLAASATARRLREAAFLPIQSPTEAQLRWELSRSA
jgi:alkylation response protein AidB-like acyl-CoA dehydrogenase